MMRTRALLPWGASAAGLLMWEACGGDIWLAQLLGVGPAGRTQSILVALHSAGRWAAAAALLCWAILALRAGAAGEPSRAEHGFAWGLTLILLLLVPVIKRFSLTSCPWDLALFGGSAQYLSHWTLWWPGSGDGGPGHCFPSGHAASAFAFAPGVWLWWRYDRRRAWAWAAAVTAAGLVATVTQTMRGAHFLSHSLWTAWLCAAVSAWAMRLSARSRAAYSAGRPGDDAWASPPQSISRVDSP